MDEEQNKGQEKLEKIGGSKEKRKKIHGKRKGKFKKEKPSARIKSIMRPRPNPCTVQEGLTDQDRNRSTNLSAKRWQVCAAQIPPSAQMTSNLTLNCTF